MRLPVPSDLSDIARDIPTTEEDVAALRRLRLGAPGENLLPLLIRLQSRLPPADAPRTTPEGWPPFEL